MKEQLDFETALKKLEEIVQELESDDLSLEQALNRFEEGITLSKYCTKSLEQAEKKVKQLITDSQGNIIEAPWEESATEEPDEF